MVTSRAEDYLESIFEIEMEGRLPSVTEIASQLNVRKATVAISISNLTNEGLLFHQKYGKIALTRAGLQRALITLRRHQMLTLLFADLLGIDSTVARNMACSAEHQLTTEADHLVTAFLEFFSAEKQSNAPWIGRLNAALKRGCALSQPLTMLVPGQSGVVSSVFCGDNQRRTALSDLGIIHGAKILRCGNDSQLQILLDSGDMLELPLETGVSVWVCPEGPGDNQTAADKGEKIAFPADERHRDPLQEQTEARPC